MSTSNVSRARQYLQVVASGEAFEKVADFYTPDVVIQEFPNRIAPHGRIRRAADIRPAYEQGRQILQSQTYNVQRILESGDDVAVELEWTGILALPVMNLPAGTEMKASSRCFSPFATAELPPNEITTAIRYPRCSRNIGISGRTLKRTLSR